MSDSFYVNRLKGALQGVPAIICGAGPSLYQNRDVLKRLQNKAFIIAGGSALTALAAYGIDPHMGVIVDPNTEEVERMKKVSTREVPVVYSLRVNKDVFQYLDGPLGYIKSIAGGLDALSIESELGLSQEETIGWGLSREAFSVTALNVSLAQYLGCSSMALVGVDLALEQGKRYACGVVEEKHNKLDEEAGDPGNITIKQKNADTLIKWSMEARAISDYKRKFGLNITNASNSGLEIEDVKYASLAQLEALPTYDNLKETVLKQYSDAALKIPANTIDMWKQKLKKSFMLSAKYIVEIKKASLAEAYPKALAYRLDLEEESAYKYFLQRPKRALMQHFEDNNFELWDQLYAITNYYLQSF